MSFRIAVFVVIFLTSFSLSGQNSGYESDSLTFIKESKTLIIRLIGAYMEDYEAYKLATKRELSDSEKEGKRLFSSRFIEKIESDPDPNSLFEQVTPFLKGKGWSVTGVRLFNELVANQKEELRSKNKTFWLESVSHNVNIEISDDNKNDANKRVAWKKVLAKINKKEPQKKVESAKIIPQKPADPETNSRKVFNPLNIVGYLASLLIGSIIGYRLFSRTIVRRNRDYEKKIKSPVNEHFKRPVKQPRSEQEEHNHQEKLQRLDKNIKFKTEPETRTNDIKDPKPDAVSDDDHRSEPNLEQVPENKPKTRTLFFGPPNTKGGFEIAKGTSTSEGVVYFKIEWEEGSSEGKIAFVPNENLFGRALDSIDQSIKPVCDIDNYEGYTKAEKIDPVKAGKVFLKSEEWTIDPENKIKIRLI
tara:strand:- start:8813 stop:10063 length:1251 start_codon:yes stop_codon:yes gene_type:complete